MRILVLILVCVHLASGDLLNDGSESDHHDKNLNPAVKSLIQAYLYLERSKILYVLLSLGGLLLFLMFGGSLAGIYFGCQYYKLKNKGKDEISGMEEGSSTDEEQSSSSKISSPEESCDSKGSESDDEDSE